MYASFEVAPDLVQLTLPSTPNVPPPFGFPANVWVLRGPTHALVGSGLAGAREPLIAALAEVGVAPERVTKVLLTSTLPEAIGNVVAFPNASVHVIGDAPTLPLGAIHRTLRDELAAVMFGLVDGEEGHPSWSRGAVESFLEAYFGDLPETLAVAPLADGDVVRAGRARLRVVPTPGIDPRACCFVDDDASRLFGGETTLRTPAPRVRTPQDFTASLERLAPLTPDLILPAHGGVERSYFALFRSINLSVSNLVQNMPFALQGPTTVARIAHNDVGYWPRDVVRFAAHVMHFKVMLDELVDSGVAQRTGTGVWARYAMDRPPRA